MSYNEQAFIYKYRISFDLNCNRDSLKLLNLRYTNFDYEIIVNYRIPNLENLIVLGIPLSGLALLIDERLYGRVDILTQIGLVVFYSMIAVTIFAPLFYTHVRKGARKQQVA